MKGLFCLFVALVPLSAQSWMSPQIPQELVTYLQLTKAQGTQIVANNNAYSELVRSKNQRMDEVQAEIAVETAKESIDPSALGVRYREIELICRDIDQAGVDVRKQNIDLLNDTQKAKLSALEEAMKLVPLFNQAQIADLLAPSASIYYSGLIGVYSPIGYGVVTTNANACHQPVVSGNFGALLPPTSQPHSTAPAKP